MRRLTRVLCFLPFVVPILPLAQETQPDAWARVRFLVGHWQVTASGQAGEGVVTRQYEFVLGQRYIYEKNISRYPPQENKTGEVHEHWSLFSRETYEILAPDEFIETFELAPPDKPFDIYSKNHFMRVRP